VAILKPTPKPGSEQDVLALLSKLGPGTADSGGKIYAGEVSGFRPPGAEEKGRVLKRAKWISETDALAQFYGWSDKKRRDFTNKLVLAGLAPVGAGALEAEEGWKKLVQAAGRYGATGKKVTPMDLLSGYVKASGGAAKNAWQQQGAFEVNVITGAKRFAGPGVYLGGGVARQTDVRTDLTDPDTARAIATKLFQNLMGRDPGAGELGAFARALHAAEAAAPVTQTTDTTYDLETGQPIATNATSSGGMTAEGRGLIGENQIKKTKEYGVTQAATTYMGAFENLIYGAPE
jgi:hypothetical protein